MDREWSQTTGLLQGNIPAGSHVRLLLTADALLRSPTTGQIDPASLEANLRISVGSPCKIVEAWQNFRLNGGYNRRWGLPLPQGLCLAAGSVVRLRFPEEIPEELWLATEAQGIGERRKEGFGAIVFLPDAEGISGCLNAPKSKKVPEPQEPPGPLINLLQRRFLQQELTAAASAAGLRLASKVQRPPSRSLLGRLRIPLRERAPDEAKDTMLSWLNREHRHCFREPAKKQLERCRIDGNQLDDWLRNTFANPSAMVLEPHLGLAMLRQKLSMMPTQEVERLVEELLPATRLVFVDAVLAGMARNLRNQERRSS